ncbi:leu operon leader peptide [Hafnia alvei]|uniref:Leu operon attenuator peptide n=1 Tax=Hafnia alvei TaxID=569 RepID=A0ABD7Q7A9_HAFAL|nr:hypothetical protein ERL64_06555 [Hafnia alvei]NEY29832.1 leu operon leader peptide [Escherichia coli]RLR10482.1 hypothetical protein EAE69_10745 [Hafnia alvei ATCC 13337]TBL77220.1 hypothetical protein EYY94_04420 [Obesumbacterium proteus]MBI0277420.1 leu operon leader peptide [Hafnia alvei]
MIQTTRLLSLLLLASSMRGEPVGGNQN